MILDILTRAMEAQSTWSVEYIGCISAVKYVSPNECSDMKQDNLLFRLQ